MNSSKEGTGLDLKVMLSTLWIFILFNMTFLDIHSFLKPGFIEEIMTGTVNGTKMTQELLLLGAIMMEIPIAMVLLSRLLKYKVNRWANIIAGVTIIAIFVGNLSTDLDNIFVGTIVIVSLSLIVWFAWKWPNPELGSDSIT